MFTHEQVSFLSDPLSKSNVKTRKNYGGSGSLSYITAWHAIAEANRIFGFGGWDRETVSLEMIEKREYKKNGSDMTSVAYMARVRVTVRGENGLAVREGCGFGTGQSPRSEEAHELALKEAESDAMKRAMMTFGNQFGLALYDKEQKNVSNDPPPKAKAAPAKSTPAPSAPSAPSDPLNQVNKEQVAVLTAIVTSIEDHKYRGEVVGKFLSGYGIKTASELPEEHYAAAKARLEQLAGVSGAKIA